MYLDGGARRSVCELCTSRAHAEGWIREGTVPDFDARNGAGERRRSLLGRLRARREGGNGRDNDRDYAAELEPAPTGPRAAQAPLESLRRARDSIREPRHVHAVPTSTEHKLASAVEFFNDSEHRRTVAGVARSLGPPTVSVLASEARPAVVHLVVSWELCWYRYEVDLSDDQPSVRVAGQGYELDELAAPEREHNASADENGTLALALA